MRFRDEPETCFWLQTGTCLNCMVYVKASVTIATLMRPCLRKKGYY